MASEFTVADLVEETRLLLQGTQRETLNFLSTAVDSDDTTFAFSDVVDSITPGSYLGVDDEIVYVRTVDKPNRSVVVARAERGSDAASHASGARVEINPRFPRFAIKRALRNDIRSWPTSVFAVGTLSINSAAGQRAYDLVGVTGDVYGLLEVQISPQSTDVSVLSWPTFQAKLDINMPNTQFPSGKAVVLSGPGAVYEGRTIRVSYAKPFTLTTFADATTIDVLGLSDSMFDIPSLGAAWRLMLGRETRRVQMEAQGEPRGAEEVPVRAVAAASEDMRRTRDTRLGTEAMRLRESYPWKGF